MKGFILSFGLALSLSGLIMMGCETNPADPTFPKDKDLVANSAENSAQIYGTVSSVAQMSEILRGPDNKVKFSSPDIQNPQQAVALAKRVKQHVLQLYIFDHQNKIGIHNALSDSLLWQFMKRNLAKGYTEVVRVYYDFSADVARVEDIKFEYDDRHRIQRDSVVVKAKLNFTLEDESDDILQSLEEFKSYKPGHPIQEENISIVLEPYQPGTEPTDGVFTNTIKYIESNFVSKTVERAELHAGVGGSWSKE
ncbi:MAG: hypothetical protein D6814_13945, partial [Calditrichaeota bacterium]